MKAKILALLILLATTNWGVGLVICNAEASDATSNSAGSPSGASDQLSKKAAELNRKLGELENRISNETMVAELNKQVSELRDSVREGRNESLDSASTSLSNLISLNSWMISFIGLVVAIFALWGIKNIRDLKVEIKQEISNELTLKYQQNLIQETAKLQADYTRELNDLTQKVDQLQLAIRQLTKNERPTEFTPPKEQAESKENAFD